MTDTQPPNPAEPSDPAAEPDPKEQLEAARAAKSKAKALFDGVAIVSGVGITRKEGRYAVKVNLEEVLPDGWISPETVDDVPLVVRVLGPIRKSDKPADDSED